MLTNHHVVVLEKLDAVLEEAMDTGLLDEMQAHVESPDSITTCVMQ